MLLWERNTTPHAGGNAEERSRTRIVTRIATIEDHKPYPLAALIAPRVIVRRTMHKPKGFTPTERLAILMAAMFLMWLVW